MIALCGLVNRLRMEVDYQKLDALESGGATARKSPGRLGLGWPAGFCRLARTCQLQAAGDSALGLDLIRFYDLADGFIVITAACGRRPVNQTVKRWGSWLKAVRSALGRSWRVSSTEMGRRCLVKSGPSYYAHHGSQRPKSASLQSPCTMMNENEAFQKRACAALPQKAGYRATLAILQ
ncbi:hypothetical protein LPB74_16445 [Pseudomonas syringae]